MEEILKPIKTYRHRNLKNFLPSVEVGGEKMGKEGDVPLVIILTEEGHSYRDALDTARENSRLNA
jgi:hypothetical protein